MIVGDLVGVIDLQIGPYAAACVVLGFLLGLAGLRVLGWWLRGRG